MAKYELPEPEKKEDVVGKDVAVDEFMRMAARWSIKIKDYIDDDEEKASVKGRDLIIDQIRSGVVTIDSEDLTPSVTGITKAGDSMTVKFGKPGGELKAMDLRKEGHSVGKLYASIGAWGDIHPSKLYKFEQFYQDVCQALFMLFFIR